MCAARLIGATGNWRQPEEIFIAGSIDADPREIYRHRVRDSRWVSAVGRPSCRVANQAAEFIMWRSFLECGYSELISSGGDSRLRLNSEGLNGYGSSCQPRDELSFSSCSASSPSPRCVAAAEALIVALRSTQTPKWIVADAIENVRRVLRSTMEISEDAEIALTPSGTASALLAVGLVDREPNRPLLNLIVGPRETGSGTMLAASGQHFDRKVPRGGSVERGIPVDPGFGRRMESRTVEIREPDGRVRAAAEVDVEIQQGVSEAVENGYRVLIHAAAHSKTGLFAPRLETLKRICAGLPGEVDVLVDAAQGRLGASFGTVSAGRLVAQGWMVHVTGSKFFGGPPSSGALIVPRSLGVRERRHGLPLAFGNYFSRAEMPKEWTAIRQTMDSWINIPAIVRWTGATSELHAFHRIPRAKRVQILKRFEESARRSFASQRELTVLPAFDHAGSDWSDGSSSTPATVISILLGRGKSVTAKELASIRRSLHGSDSSSSVELGHPAEIAPERWAARVALGAPMVTRVANDCSIGKTFKKRMDWLDKTLRDVAERASSSIANKQRQIA